MEAESWDVSLCSGANGNQRICRVQLHGERMFREWRIQTNFDHYRTEAPVRTEFLLLLRISEFFGFQWQNLAEILSLFKLYNNLGKVAVRMEL